MSLLENDGWNILAKEDFQNSSFDLKDGCVIATLVDMNFLRFFSTKNASEQTNVLYLCCKLEEIPALITCILL